MNHLAHLYLSRHSEKMMLGNFIADTIKGKRYLDYDPQISTGILMHREIDSFTDSNYTVKHSKSYFRERYGLYASVLIDMCYDHFLAKNFEIYSEETLEVFADRCYYVLALYQQIMPPRNQHMFPYMQKENWLVGYRSIDGISRSLSGLARRIKNNPGIEYAAKELQSNYEAIEHDFLLYFPTLIKHIEPYVSKA